MVILVTGAAGFIGSHLSERLGKMGHSVRAVDCFTDYYSLRQKKLNATALEQHSIHCLPLDLATDVLDDVVEDVEVIYHLAAQPGLSATTTFDTFVRNNLTATHQLIEACRRQSSLRLFVNVSTSSVYGINASGNESSEPKPTSNYGVTKLAAEQLVLSMSRDQGMPACSLRLFSVYGPRERPEKLYPQLISSILEGREFHLFEGSEHHLRSFTYVGDIIDGMVAVLDKMEECTGEIFNIGTDVAITTGEGISIVEEIVGKTAKIARKPKRAGDQLQTHANIEKARSLLGYNPTTEVKAGLRKQIEWHMKHMV